MAASQGPTSVTGADAGEPAAVLVRQLSFSFPFGREVIHDLNLELPRGSRCLLCGANGAGELAGSGRPARAAELSLAGCVSCCLRVRALLLLRGSRS